MGYHHGLYTGVTYEAKECPNAIQMSQLDQFIADLVQARKQDSIVSVFMMPKAFFNTNLPAYPVYQSYTVNRPTSIAGYTPRNKKLLTYPYCFVNADALNGSKIYRYELSNYSAGAAIYFSMACAVTPNPEILCAPVAYNGIPFDLQNLQRNYTESLICSGFPQCAFMIDSYRAWLAQKANGEILGAVGSAVGAVGSIAAGNVIGGVIGAVGLANSVNNIIQDSTQGNRVRGGAGGSVEVATRGKGIYFKQMNVDAEHAHIIDDYFDRFGYSCERIKTPNRTARPHWTYIKTRGCSLVPQTSHGSVPADVTARIKQIYDNGITFWRSTSRIGDYSQDNRV